MSTPSEEREQLIYSPTDNWNQSLESIITQKVTKISKSESLFDFPKKFELSFSEVELRKIHLQNAKDKTKKWEFVSDKPRASRVVQTRSMLRDELEILKINMSADEKVDFRDSQFIQNSQPESKKKKKKMRTFLKFLSRSPFLVMKFKHGKVRDLLTEIEGSESAKTDTVIWKFLKRGPALRRDFINSRKLILQIQALRFPDFYWLTDSIFQNAQPTKVTCPNCRFYITTHIKKVSTVRTKLTSIMMGMFGLCMVPHIIYAFKDTVHLCPLCKIYLGFCPAFNIRFKKRTSKSLDFSGQKCQNKDEHTDECSNVVKMVSASSTSAKNLFVESKLRLSDRVQVNVNNIAAITRQIQRGSKSNENLMAAAKNFALQEAAIENSETNLKKLRLLTTHIHNQLDSLNNSSSNVEVVLEQVRSMQR